VEDSNGGGLKGQADLEERHFAGETVEAWDCSPGCAVRMLDEQSGELKSGEGAVSRESGADRSGNTSSALGAESRPAGTEMVSYGDRGGASRFFYCAKASRAERNAGLAGFEKQALNWSSGAQGPGTFQSTGTEKAAQNFHPTVKPIDLMRWLVRLVTPPRGTVLDPFTGSGTTGCGAVLEGFNFIGIEREAEYTAIARARITFWAEHPDGLSLDAALVADRGRRAVAEAGQLSLESAA
jgi:hypothetical protein